MSKLKSSEQIEFEKEMEKFIDIYEEKISTKRE